jgi:glutaredoxin-like protein
MAFKNLEGQKVPEVTFRVREGSQWKDLTTEQLFKNKKVVLFALPGAYTPTCSTSHLPRYNELLPVFKKNGIDSILCLSVNDTFVMNEWAKDQKADGITMLPDGNGEFSEKMGLLVDKSNLGFGKRSWRYSMLVDNGVIKKMFIEAEKDGDPFEVSDADTMLNYINPKAEKPRNFTIFTKPGCPFCAKAKALLTEKGFAYEEISTGSHNVSMKSVAAVTGKSTVPQVFENGKLIGGSEDLAKYLA